MIDLVDILVLCGQYSLRYLSTAAASFKFLYMHEPKAPRLFARFPEFPVLTFNDSARELGIFIVMRVSSCARLVGLT